MGKETIGKIGLVCSYICLVLALAGFPAILLGGMGFISRETVDIVLKVPIVAFLFSMFLILISASVYWLQKEK